MHLIFLYSTVNYLTDTGVWDPHRLDISAAVLIHAPCFPCYRPQTMFAKVMFLHLSVILFTGGGLQQCNPGIHTPLPREQTTHLPPCAVHAGRCGQQVGGMHPTGMHSCFVKSFYCEKCRSYSTFLSFASMLQITVSFVLRFMFKFTHTVFYLGVELYFVHIFCSITR